MTYPKKLIEVALPLEAINKESAREKSIRHGHPSTLHLWWARRPLAACRAVLFSSLVDDPSEYIEDEEKQKEERERLFQLIEQLVKWENINNDEVLDRAKLEIARSVARNMGEEMPVGKKAIEEFLATKAPPVLDPFAGGGSIPLEAQRLGLRAYASDLNPVAVLINKAMIEIPPKFANMPPMHPPKERELVEIQDMFSRKEWKGAGGLAEDVRFYGQWIRDEAEKQIGHLYPRVKVTQEMLDEMEDLRQQELKPGDELTVVAWLWTREVVCPNPVCKANTPLIKSFLVSSNENNLVSVIPRITKTKEVILELSYGKSNKGGTVNRSGAKCLVCNTSIPFNYIRSQGQHGNLSKKIFAQIVETNKNKIALQSNKASHIPVSFTEDDWIPDTELVGKAAINVPLYGLIKHKDLFTTRQLKTLSVFSSLVAKVEERIFNDALMKFNDKNISSEYAKAISTYLACALSRGADFWSTIATWVSSGNFVSHTFTRQALPFVWDFAEANPFSSSSGNWSGAIDWVTRVLDKLPDGKFGSANQGDAKELEIKDKEYLVSTDPPYYDNIEYSDLSDYFYVWLRNALSNIYPNLFGTVLTPKSDELIAVSHRFEGNKEKAKEFFEVGLSKVFSNIRKGNLVNFPFTVFYAFKQTEEKQTDELASTGWETMLEGLFSSGFQVTGTWPMRTERGARSVSIGSNALASSIVLVCRPRQQDTSTITRRDYLVYLRKELPDSIQQLQQGNIAPVDLAQAAIGPGMAIFSRYDKVLEANGTPMSVRSALALINQVLDEYLAEQEGDFDSDTRWAVAWFEQFGHQQGAYGVAETLSKAKNTSVGGLVQAGFLESRAGNVRLLARSELEEDWTPEEDKRLTAWEAAQYLIQELDTKGEQAAAELLSRLGTKAEPARELAYRLYTICERKGWAQDALGYNMLVVAWPRLKELASKISPKLF